MRERLIQRAGVLAILAGGVMSSAAAALPPYVIARPYKSNMPIPGMGPINSAFTPTIYGGAGILGLAVNNSGTGYIHVGLPQAPPPPAPLAVFGSYNHAVLFTGTGLTPFMGGGLEAQYDLGTMSYLPITGSVIAPSINYIYDEFFWTAINNNGVGAFAARIGTSSFATETPLTAVYFNNTALPIRQGDPVTAAGVAPGTVFGPIGPDRIARYQNASPLTSTFAINDNNVYLYAGVIVESGQNRRAILKIAVSGAGAVVSQTLVAKQGGPVGAGPDTWTAISTTPNTCAINNVGQAIFTGTTAGGTDGIYRTDAAGSGGAFVAVAGGAAPGGGVWGPLLNAPVDVNNSGRFAFRGVVQGINTLWSEIGSGGELGGDAGETFSNFLTYTANGTTGGGPLSQINGTLANDHDVDVYYISVGDPTIGAQVPFSATTVPNPGAGFDGAAFDTVLYLFADNQNCNGNTRVGVGRCDDAAPGVPQSTLTTSSLRSDHTPGTKYFLGISTPKARAQSRGIDTWQSNPSKIIVTNGAAHWIEPGKGQILRADTATGLPLAPLTIGPLPSQTSGGQPGTPEGALLDVRLGLCDAGAASKFIFHQRGWNADRFRTCNLDGSGVQDITFPTGSGFSSNGVTSFAVDSINAKLYWSRPGAENTAIMRSDLDGNNPEFVVRPLDPCVCDNYFVNALAIDTFGTGRVYWYEATGNRIVYEELTDLPDLIGAHLHPVITAANVVSMTIDSTARRLYYTSATSNKIGVINLTTNSALPDLLSTATPDGVAVDSAAQLVYWTSPRERLIRRTPVSTPAAQDWLALGADIGERPSEGPNYMDCVVNGWPRTSTATPGALPYQIKLTGVTFANQAAMICKDNTTKIVLGGEPLASTGNRPLTAVGSTAGPVRISDRGLVAWRGQWFTATNSLRRGLFLNSDLIFDGTVFPVGGGTQIGDVDSGISGFDMSTSGQYIFAHCAFGTASGGNSGVMVSFDSIPGCAADFNGNGSIDVGDIFAFLTAWFGGSPSADFDGAGGITVSDIFAFLTAWFAGCA